MLCYNCKSAPLQLPEDNHPSYLVCPNCGALHLTYEPLPHQAHMHANPAVFIGYFGGFGSAKTRSAVQDIFLQALEQPNTTWLIGAQTHPQLQETAMQTFFAEVCPPPLIKEHKTQDRITILQNGSRILWRSFDDEGKLRSLNLSGFHIEEASEVKFDIFLQLQGRLRNSFTKRFRGIVTSNPERNWIFNEFVAHTDHLTDKEDRAPFYFYEHEKKDYAVYVVPTKANKYLPPGFIERLRATYPEWWQKRYLDGSFAHSEGMVYPEFADSIIEPFSIPGHWDHVIALDWGIRNPTAVIFIAVNPLLTTEDTKKPLVVVYDEYYEANKTVPEHAVALKERLVQIPPGRLRDMRIDPSCRNRNPETGKSIQALFAEYGLYFKPANNDLEAGIAKVASYIRRGALKVFSTCKHTIDEGLNYRWRTVDFDRERNLPEQPIDYKNHLMDALRYALMTLPDDPEQLMNPSYDPWGFGSQVVVTREGEIVRHKQGFDPLSSDDYLPSDWTEYV